MECISCETVINPKWTFAISENICPMCGKCIMPEDLKESLASLREVLLDLQEYPDQLNDWLLSNYNYIKTDSPNVINYIPKDMLRSSNKVDEDFQKRKDSQKFTVKVMTENGEEDVLAEKIQSDDKTSDFFKRAQNIKTGTATQHQSASEKTQYLKRVAQQIKKAGSLGIAEDGGSMMISADMLENADSDAVADLQSMMSDGDISSSLSDMNDDGDIPQSVLAMASKGQSGNGYSKQADLMKLQQMQDRVRNSREAFESGSNRGSGGFSRS